MCMLTRYIRFSIFIKFLDVFDLQFQGQRFESNTVASAYVKSAWNALQSFSETLHSHYRHDGRYQSPRYQAVLRVEESIHFVKVCQAGAYRLIFKQFKHSRQWLSSECARVCARLYVLVDRAKTYRHISAIYSPSYMLLKRHPITHSVML